MATRTITPGQRLKAAFCGSVVKTDAEWEELAKELSIQPLTVEVPPPTDGELIQNVMGTCHDYGDEYWERIAAEFLRLVRERDGEPLPVDAGWLTESYRVAYRGGEPSMEERWNELADRINAHRGVRPAELPKVTAEMIERVLCRQDVEGVAESLNAELEKLRKDGAW